MTDPFDRRTFLRYTAAAAAAAMTPTAAAAEPGRRGNRVVVLGAGLAGLAAAYTLMRRGYEVTVLEAQDRPGGRVLTVRKGFKRGGHAEMGAIRVPETHEYTLKYIREFGLELVPYDTGTRAFYLQGRRFLAPPAGTPWPLKGFHPNEQPHPEERLPEYLLSGFDKLGDIFDPGWPGAFPSALELDAVTVADYMRAQGASETWLEWLWAQEGRIARANAAAAFAVESQGGAILGSIKGGNDRLPYAIANALGHRVKYKSPVVRIRQDRHGVRVGYLDHGRRRELTADRCVCALPFATLRRADIAFSPRKMKAIHTLRYMAAARCYFQTRTRFWQHDPLGPLGGLNLVGTDTMAGRVWNTSSQQADPALGMIHAYMFDTEALEFASHGHARVAAMRRLFAKLLPGSRGQIIAAAYKSWEEDPWAGGAWGWTQPGELRWMFPAMREPDGRVHFAGEHTSLWITYMNGALESGERAAQEILEADATPRRPRRARAATPTRP